MQTKCSYMRLRTLLFLLLRTVICGNIILSSSDEVNKSTLSDAEQGKTVRENDSARSIYGLDTTEASAIAVTVQSADFTGDRSKSKIDAVDRDEDPVDDVAHPLADSLPKTAQELGVPVCHSDDQCTHAGYCLLNAAKKTGQCLCSASCPSNVPAMCVVEGGIRSNCLTMGDEYRQKYDLSEPHCHQNWCVCSPKFEPSKKTVMSETGLHRLLLAPMKCDKRELKLSVQAVPEDAVYRSTNVNLYCCLNVDPRGIVDSDGVDFIQNGTVVREPTETPYDSIANETDYEILAFQPPTCWRLQIKNVQFSDSGNYMCKATSLYDSTVVNATIAFVVKAPRSVKNLSVKYKATSAQIEWENEEGPMLKIDMKLLRRTDNTDVWEMENAKSPLFIDGLKPASPYTLFIKVFDGPNEVPLFTHQFTTSESKPESPDLIDIRKINMGDRVKCEVEWRPPKSPNGRITKYWVTVTGGVRYIPIGGALTSDHYPQADTIGCYNMGAEPTSAVRPSSFPNDFFSCSFGPLKPNRNYSASIIAENSAGRSISVSFDKQCVTDYDQPDAIASPRAQASLAKNNSRFVLHMPSPPDQTNGPIACYYLAVVPMMSNITVDRLPSPGALVFDEFAKTLDNNRNFAEISGRYFAYIAESYADELPKSTIIGDGNATAGVEPCNTWFLSRNEPADPVLRRGLQYTGMLVARVDRDARVAAGRDEGLFARRRRAVAFSPDPAYGYSPYFRPVFLAPLRAIDSQGTPIAFWWPLLLFILSLLIATFSAFAVVYVLKRKGLIKDICPRKKSLNRTLIKHTGFQPIPVDDLPSEYIIRHRDSDFLFTNEFEALPHYNNFDTTASEKRDNVRKNRYNDIKAFDVTRVKLLIDSQDPSSSDYINASFVHGYKGRKTFIAAQGPLDNTIVDFWTMIWEQHVQIVVMVTNLYEKYRVQCSKYWPDEESSSYGQFEVRAVESTYYADYAVRSFEIRKVHDDGHVYDSVAPLTASLDRPCSQLSKTETDFGGRTPDARRVVQYHYTGWNDYRAPDCTTGLLRFLFRLRKMDIFNETRVVVHCSAGVGRTGTFIAIDGLLDQCNEEKKADVFGFVSNLRRQRNYMVQSLEQYVFVYKALAEWHLFGDTDIEVERIHAHVASLKEAVSAASHRQHHTASAANSTNNGFRSPRLSRISAGSRCLQTAMDVQFKKLENSLENERSGEFAKKEENAVKNRFDNAVPFDRNRVILSPLVGYVDPSYINASLVKGYFYPYILAQDPVSVATCFDFWRMVKEQNATSIVTLSCEADFTADEKYWPEEIGRGKTYGKQGDISIQLMSEEEHSTYISRKFNVCTSKEKEVSEVVQLSYGDWPPGLAIPRSTASLLELIGRVLQRQSFLPHSGPIILHCRDGSGRSGLYCCVSLLLERLKAEGRVDVFQTVKSLQAQRPLIVNSMEQYSFCYQSVLDYLESFR